MCLLEYFDIGVEWRDQPSNNSMFVYFTNKGDAYRYTIQPVYQNIKEEFKCHIKHRQPKVLYELFYSIEVPGTSFKTEPVYKTVYAGDLDYQGHGEYITDYITMEHSSGLDLNQEFILIGKDTEDKKFNYTLHNLKTAADYKRKRVVVHEVSPKILVASTQFERPFDYSTSNWKKQGMCDKNITKFKHVQPQYMPEAQPVTVSIQSVGAPYKYLLKSTENQPFIRSTIPGEMPWWACQILYYSVLLCKVKQYHLLIYLPYNK